jgi:hypothetical protein
VFKNTKNEKKPERRTQVKDLPRSDKELSSAEQEKVKGSRETLAVIAE